MTDRELMQQALDALEGYARNCRCEGGGAPCDAAEALRARLAQPEQKHSEQWWRHEVSNAYANGYEKGRASVKQPEQEPVAWKDAPLKIYLQVCDESDCDHPFDSHIEVSWCQDKINDSDIPYFRADTAPPQREWQGLTDEERTFLAWESNNGSECVAMTEAKLKEKNIG